MESSVNSVKAIFSWVIFSIMIACAPSKYTSAPIPAGSRQTGIVQPGGSASQGPSTSQPNAPAANSNAGTTNGNETPASEVKFASGIPEADALRKCMNLWGSVPFKEVKRENVKVMNISVGIGSGLFGNNSTLSTIGNLLNLGNPKDLEFTSEPKLVIIPLTVNLGGNMTFELMNPNGWYCIKTAVGAKSTLNIKLNCSAKIAQSDLGINLSTKTETGSALPVKLGVNDGQTPGGQLGIFVDSDVKVTRLSNSSGATCSP